MNKLITGFFVTTAIGALLAAPQDASAGLRYSGAICNPYNAGEANDIDNLVAGVRTTATSARNVICAVPHETGSPGITVNFRGLTTSSTTMPITLYAFDNSGNVTGSTSINPTGGFNSSPTLTSGQSPVNSYNAALVTLPASTTGILYAISPT